MMIKYWVKWYVRTVLILLLIGMSSLFMHEGVHYVQQKIDPNVEPDYLVWVDNATYPGIDWWIGSGIGLQGKWEEGITNEQKLEYMIWYNEEGWIIKESQAYGVQLIFFIGMVYILWRRKQF